MPNWPKNIWTLSFRLEERGNTRAAKLAKAANSYLHRTLLSSQVKFHPSIRLEHHGMGVVIHPNVTIGEDVVIWHNVTIAAETNPGSPHRVVIDNGVMIGAGATIVARPDAGLRVGAR